MLAKISWRLILIVVSAGGIAFLTFQYLDSLQETRTIVVTDTDISEQTEIEEDMLETVTVEAQSADTLLSEEVENPEEIAGAITREDIDEGEPVRMDPDLLVLPDETAEYLEEDGSVDLSEFIPNDKRLYTVALEPDGAVDNRLEKGDHVDVIYTGESIENGEAFSRMIIQYSEVHEVENYDEEELGNLAKDNLIQHVTLLVSPQEAVAIANAEEEGDVSLALNPSDGEEVEVEEIFESTLEN